MSVSLFGIRHHGPGSARSLVAALDRLRPDIVLIEGPPDAHGALHHAASEEMHPPVALLAYAVENPRRAVFYPFASFSPEWLALRHAFAHGVPARFIDLPAGRRLALDGAGADEFEDDPIRWLAAAAGYDDPERWWEDLVEHRLEGADPFAAIAEAMTALRTEAAPVSDIEARREAHMRSAIRTARREGYVRVAVVCGAWHVPALDDGTTARADAELLRGLKRVKTAVTWVPWTHGRLSYHSGYGAGVESPGWYHHLFTAPDDVVVRWLTSAARMLRDEDLEASSAEVIDAVRMAETLAVLRGRPLAGLAEVTDAALAVLGRGSESALTLIRDRLVVGEVLGEVPDGVPAVPLQRDLEAQQRRLRLKPEASRRDVELDLRRPSGLDRSHLLHRLEALGIPWGVLQRSGTATGTFAESWSLRWHPEFSVQIIEVAMWGSTVADAATARIVDAARNAPDLAALTGLAERSLLADLPGATGEVMAALSARAAVEGDAGHLMAALPALARVLRYGNVRRTDADIVARVLDGLVARICIGLPLTCSSLDDDAALRVRDLIAGANDALAVVQRADLREQWWRALSSLSQAPELHGLIAGFSSRLLLDAGEIDFDEGLRRMSVALSPAAGARAGAAWVEGFLSGSALVLLHDASLMKCLDAWIRALPSDAFVETLPLLRRTFSRFTPPERRMLGERVKQIDGDDVVPVDDLDIDHEHAETALPLLARIFGVDGP